MDKDNIERETGIINSTYQFGVEGLPICMRISPHCLQKSHEAWAVPYNYSHVAANTVIIVTRSFHSNHTVYINETIPSSLTFCPIPEVSPNIEVLEW